MLNINVAFGFFFAFCLKEIFSLTISEPKLYWRFIFGFPLVTTILQQVLLMTVYNHETVKYLLVMGRSEEAKDLIRLTYEEEWEEIIYEEKLQDLESEINRENDEK